MKWYKNFLFVIYLIVLSGCGGGGSSSSEVNSTPTQTQVSANLAPITIVYGRSPSINQELTISIQENTEVTASNYSWRVISEPSSSNVSLNIATDTKSLRLTPSVAGQYEISITSATGEVSDTQFLIAQEFPFDESKLEELISTEELSKQSGIVANQAWVYSTTLNQASLRTIIETNTNFTVLGFDQIKGLLVEFDESAGQSQVSISTLKSISGIDSVEFRVFRGNDFIHPPLKIANDGSEFDDGGDNWHLESIGIDKAWDITSGSDDFLIGVLDGNSFDTEHEDLKGRFRGASKGVVTEAVEIAHGTASSGTIGAIANNEIGMSGINWSNQILAAAATFDNLTNMMSIDEVALINMSVNVVGYVRDYIDTSNPNLVEEMEKISFAQSRDYRKLISENSTHLLLLGAGNGIGNGLGNNGVYGVDGRLDSPALQYEEVTEGSIVLATLENVLFVAAHTIDNKLVYYSNYGESVEIAAPTSYKSTSVDRTSFVGFLFGDGYYKAEDEEYGSNATKAFSGTSAATPVVTGVASLIYAANPAFSAADVKTILIKSATDFITERYTTPFKDTEGNFDTAILDIPIPRLNAASALAMTKDIVDAREIIVEHKFSNPFSPIVNVNFSTNNNDVEINSIDYVVSVKNNITFEELLNGTVAGFSPLVFQNIDPEKTNYKITGTSKVPVHEPTKVSLNSNFSYEFLVPKINALSSDRNTLARLPNVTIDIKAEDGSVPLSSGTTDSSGISRLYLKPGRYSIIAKADGYKDLDRTVTLKNTDTELDIFLVLEPEATNPSTGVAGENLQPITPLTNSETSTIPNVAGIPNVTSLTVSSESGFNGSINEDFSLVEGVTSIDVVDIQRDIGFSTICEGSTKPFSLTAADFSTSTINQTFYDNGQQVAACSSSYDDILPITLTNSNLFSGVLEDFGSDAPLTSNCPTINVNTTPPALNSDLCSSVVVTNYLITDVNGVEHKISTRLTTIPNE